MFVRNTVSRELRLVGLVESYIYNAVPDKIPETDDKIFKIYIGNCNKESAKPVSRKVFDSLLASLAERKFILKK